MLFESDISYCLQFNIVLSTLGRVIWKKKFFVCLFFCLWQGQRSNVGRTSKSDFTQGRFLRGIHAFRIRHQLLSSVQYCVETSLKFISGSSSETVNDSWRTSSPFLTLVSSRIQTGTMWPRVSRSQSVVGVASLRHSWLLPWTENPTMILRHVDPSV